MYKIETSLHQIQFYIDESKINNSIFDYYYALNSIKNHKIENAEPWIPVGRMGPCLVLGHYIDGEEIFAIDDCYVEKIIISEANYRNVLKRYLTHPFKYEKYHKPLESTTWLDNSDNIKVALGHIYGHCPIEIDHANCISSLLDRDFKPTDLPRDYFEACLQVIFRLGFLDLSTLKLNLEVNRLLPIALLERYKCVIIAATPSHILLGVSKRPTIELEDIVFSKLSAQFKKISFKLCSEVTITEILEEFKGKTPQLSGYYKFQDGIKSNAQNSPEPNDCLQLDELKCDVLSPQDANASSEDIFQWILFHAFIRKASDIHFEQTNEAGRVRIRIDGELQTLLELPLERSKAVVFVCKNACRMQPNDFDNQDASFTFRCGTQCISVRVNAIPFRNSFQKLALRLFTQSNVKVTINELNIPQEQSELLRKCIAKPQGLILVSGPTGEGKTTTLYALLEELNKSNTNIQTIEDPIERQIDGINQTAVDIARGVTFASVMRSIVRQDPDIILLGEIRDKETAELAIESSLTGHLVLTTIHANSSIKALARLYQLGVDPHLLANSLLILQAQRLLKKLCNKCKVLEFINEPYFKPTGCEWCNNTGFKGRIPIMEFFPVCEELQTAIAAKVSFAQLKKIFDSKGYHSLYVEAMGRAQQGIVQRSDTDAYLESWVL